MISKEGPGQKLIQLPKISHQAIKFSLLYYMQKSFLLFLNCITLYINIALDIGLIDEVNDEVQELEKKLNVYVNLVFSDKERPQCTAQTLSPSTMKGD